MSYPSYGELKDSGIEWLGRIPKHWEGTRVKFTVSKIGSGKTPKGGAEVYLNEGITFLRSQNVYDDGLRLDDVVYISEDVDEEMADTRVQPKDVLLNITGASIGRTCIVPQNFTRANVNQHVCIIRPKIVAPEFLSYFLKSDAVKDQIRASENGSSREGLNFEQVGNLLLVYPEGNESEQQAIAAFLDHKTAELDELLRLKERQIELLGAKRQALIGHAVTRGLDPSVKLRPSGIEWLGEIPKHWESKRLKFCVELINDKSDSLPDKMKYVGLENIESKTGRLLLNEESEGAVGACNLFKSGDVLFGKLRPYLAKALLAEFDGACTTEMLVMRPQQITAKYLLLYILSEGFVNAVDGSTYGAKMPRASWDFIGNLPQLIPPLEEQQAIAAFLDRKSADLDEQVKLIKVQIEKLREYRQALISAAVTGKIDVREVAHVVRDDALKQ